MLVGRCDPQRRRQVGGLRAARRIDPAGASDDVLLLVLALVEVAAFAVPDDHEVVDRVAGVVPDHDDLAVRLEGEVVGEVIAERAGGEVGGVQRKLCGTTAPSVIEVALPWQGRLSLRFQDLLEAGGFDANQVQGGRDHRWLGDREHLNVALGLGRVCDDRCERHVRLDLVRVG